MLLSCVIQGTSVMNNFGCNLLYLLNQHPVKSKRIGVVCIILEMRWHSGCVFEEIRSDVCGIKANCCLCSISIRYLRAVSYRYSHPCIQYLIVHPVWELLSTAEDHSQHLRRLEEFLYVAIFFNWGYSSPTTETVWCHPATEQLFCLPRCLPTQSVQVVRTRRRSQDFCCVVHS